MKFKDLKTFVETCGLPDDAPVLVPARDHSFRPALLQLDTVVQFGGYLGEDHGDDLTEDERRVKAIVIS